MKQDPEHSRNPLVNEIIAAYLELGQEDVSDKRRKDTARLLTAFSQNFGRLRVEDVKPVDFLRWLKGQKRWRSSHTRRNVVTTLKVAFNWAVKHDIIARNPLAQVQVTVESRRRPMFEEEYKAIIRASPALYRRILLFLKLTGARPGEVAGMKWKHIDWEREIVVLPQHKTAKKTGRPRVLILVPVLIRLLRFLERQRTTVLYRQAVGRLNGQAPGPDSADDEEPVFLNSRGGHWHGSNLCTQLIRARKQLGLPPECVLYGLRHKFLTDAICAGVNMKLVSELAGHADIGTTSRFYAHVSGQVDVLRNAALQALQPRANGQKPTGNDAGKERAS